MPEPLLERVFYRNAVDAERHLRRLDLITGSQRAELWNLLRRYDKHFRTLHRWTIAFSTALVAGPLALFFGLLTAAVEAPPWLPVSLILGAFTVITVPAVQLWHGAWRSLDIAVGVCLTETDLGQNRTHVSSASTTAIAPHSR